MIRMDRTAWRPKRRFVNPVRAVYCRTAFGYWRAYSNRRKIPGASPLSYRNHQHRANNRMRAIRYSHGEVKKAALYRDLIWAHDPRVFADPKTRNLGVEVATSVYRTSVPHLFILFRNNMPIGNMGHEHRTIFRQRLVKKKWEYAIY